MPTIKIFKFFEYIHRMAHLMRWSLMDCRKQEDLKQHSFDVALISHALVVIHNDVLDLPRKLDAAQAALLALFHDASEIFTGDVPTPIKYFGGGAMKVILEKIEGLAMDKLLGSLPDKMQPAYHRALEIPAEYKPFIKAADQLAALRKCRVEIAAGNQEFAPAAARLEETLKLSCWDMPAVHYFMANFMTDKPMSLDALIEGNGAWLIEEGEVVR